MPLLKRNRPEPFKPVDPYAEGPRWGGWVFAGIAVIAAGGLVVALGAGSPDRADPPPSAPVPAAMQAAPPAPASAEAGQVPAPAPAPLRVEEASPAAAPPAAAVQPEPPPPAAREGVTRARANLRSAPSTSGALVWTAPAGTRLQILDEEESWLRVEVAEDSRAGWMHRSLVAE